MKQLREITMNIPRIGNAQLINKNCYVYSNLGDILFIVPADQILGFTGQSITIRLAGYDITYSNAGRELSIVTRAMR